MNSDSEQRINNALKSLKDFTGEDFDFKQLDPVVKMMMVALLNETQKIQDKIDSLPQRIEDRYCTDFIPRSQMEAVPAITVLSPKFRPKKDLSAVNIESGAVFTYKKDEDKKSYLNYIPLFKTLALPYSKLCSLSCNKFVFGEESYLVSMGHANQLWIGVNTKAELSSLEGLPLLIKGTNGVHPKHIFVGSENKELHFASMNKMEDVEMTKPFDSQQASQQFLTILETWKRELLNLKDSLLVVITEKTDEMEGRDIFKTQFFPREFQQWLENDLLDKFQENSLWFRIVFPEGYTVPDHCEVIPNAFPVVNVDVCSLTLSQATPIAKLEKTENSFFLQILEPSSSAQAQGFPKVTDEIVIRDFDANCYHNGGLYRDIRNLYNRFIDDYYAFVEYNNIKDGETLKQLRILFSKLDKNFKEENVKHRFDSGTYVMRNVKNPNPSSVIKVSYITTQGKDGNNPRMGNSMENKKIPAFEQNITVAVSAICGSDKASVDKRSEFIRYYALTNDRLFTRMDVEAFLRKEIANIFGDKEFKRISIRTRIEGMGGETSLRRGLYIDIMFDDKKNYDKARLMALDTVLYQGILNKSCISMPILVSLINSEN